MTVVGSATLEFLGNSSHFRGEMDAAKRHFEAAGKRMEAAGDKFVTRLNTKLEHAARAMDNAGKSLTRNVTLPLVAAGVAATLAGVKLDSLERALVAVAGSAEEADAQMRDLREIARLPGLGLAEAVQGSVRLQAVGVQAEVAERALLAFGNAVALTGGGRAELDRVVFQFGQLSGKSKILTQDLRPIIEAAPAVAQALNKAFGTVDAQQIEALGLSTTEFTNRLFAALEQLPRVTGGPKNALENLSDAALRAGARMSESLLPVLEAAAAKGEALADTLEAMNPETLKWAAGLAIAAAATGPLLRVVGKLSTALQGANKFIGDTRAAVANTEATRRMAAATTFAAQTEAAAAVEVAAAEERETAAKLRNLAASRAAIEVSRQEAIAQLAVARAYQAKAAAVPLSQLVPLGGAAVEREMLRRAAATRAVSLATAELARLGQLQAGVEAQVAATTTLATTAQARQTAATAALTGATTLHTTALHANTLAARAAIVASRAWAATLAFFGGPVGALITALGVLAFTLYRVRDANAAVQVSSNDLARAIKANLTTTTAAEAEHHAAVIAMQKERAELALKNIEAVAKAESSVVVDVEGKGPSGIRTGAKQVIGEVSQDTKDGLQAQTAVVEALGRAYEAASERVTMLKKSEAEHAGASRLLAGAGFGALPDMATLRMVADALDDARAKLRQLEFESALPHTADQAKEAAADIEHLRARISALQGSFGGLGETAARALLDVAPAIRDVAGEAEKLRRINNALPPAVQQFGRGLTSIMPAVSQMRQEAAAAAATFLNVSPAMEALEARMQSVALAGMDAFADFATGSKNAMHDFVNSAMRDLARLAARLAVITALRALFPQSAFVDGLATAAGLAKRASGGPVMKNRAYLVGERGPELFVPAGAGSIMANGSMGGAAAAFDASILPPYPRLMSPEAMAVDDYWRRFISAGLGDHKARGGR